MLWQDVPVLMIQRQRHGVMLSLIHIYSAMKSAFHILPFMIFLALIMIVTAWLLSKWQIERLIRPINTLDLENPLEQEMYPELQPLLERIEPVSYTHLDVYKRQE